MNQAFSWATAVVTQLFQFGHMLWLLRNEHLHGSSKFCGSQSFKHLHLLSQVDDIYAAEPLMLCGDRAKVLSVPLYIRKWQSTQELQTFVRWAKPIVATSCRDAAKLDLGDNFKLIDSYFPRVPPPVPERLWDAILGRPSRTTGGASP